MPSWFLSNHGIHYGEFSENISPFLIFFFSFSAANLSFSPVQVSTYQTLTSGTRLGAGKQLWTIWLVLASQSWEGLNGWQALNKCTIYMCEYMWTTATNKYYSVCLTYWDYENTVTCFRNQDVNVSDWIIAIRQK